MSISKFITAARTVVLVAVVCFGSGTAAQEFDDYGDPLPPGAVRRLGTVSMRHGYRIDVVAFLPDSKTLVSGSMDGTVRLWDVTTGKQTSVLSTPPTSRCRRFAVSSDGTTMVVIGRTGVDLYNVDTGTTIGAIGRFHEHRHNGSVSALAFFPGGRRFASAGSDGTVRIWRLPNSELSLKFEKHKDQVSCVAVSPDGKTIASGTEFGSGWVLLWNAETGEVLHRVRSEVKGHGRTICSLSFSPDGRTLASAEVAGCVCLWNVETGKQVRQFRLGKHSTAGVTYTPDGRHLVIAASGIPNRKGRVVTAPESTPQGGVPQDLIAGEIGMWDVQTGKRIRRFDGLAQGATRVAVSPDGRLVAAGGYDGVVGLWGFASGEPLIEKPEPKTAIECLALSSRGRLLACGMHDGTVLLRDVGGGPPKATCAVSDSWVNDVCFSKDDRMVAAVGTNFGSANCVAHIWSVDERAVLHRFSCGRGMGTSVAFSPNSRLFAAANCNDGKVRIWDLKSGTLMHTLSAKSGKYDLSFTQDGKRLIAASDDLVAHKWDVESGKLVAEGHGGRMGTYVSAIGPDARWIVSSGHAGNVQVWDPAGSGAVLELNAEVQADAESRYCFGATFSDDGRYVATAHLPDLDAGRDDWQPPQIRIWELAGGSEVMRFKGHRGRVRGLAFSADVRTLVSGGWDTTALVWSLDPFADRSLPKETGAARGEASLGIVDPSGQLDADNVIALWEQLAGDAPRAYRAKWQLIHHSQQAVELFAAHLKPVSFDPTEARRWAAKLDDDSFATREHALRRLAGLGELAHGVLRETLEQGASLEAKTRIDQLLTAQHPILVQNKETLRACRAIEVLERIGSAEARELIDQLATGTAEATVTRHAQAAKTRLSSTSITGNSVVPD